MRSHRPDVIAARPDAAEARRARGHQAAARRRSRHAGDRAVGQGSRGRQGAGALARRRRLRDQAVLHRRGDRAAFARRCGGGGAPRPAAAREARASARSQLDVAGRRILVERHRGGVDGARVRPAALFLHAHPGTVFSREQLMQQVWGPDHFGTVRTVDNFVARLRAKIEDDPDAAAAHRDGARRRLSLQSVIGCITARHVSVRAIGARGRHGAALVGQPRRGDRRRAQERGDRARPTAGKTQGRGRSGEADAHRFDRRRRAHLAVQARRAPPAAPSISPASSASPRRSSACCGSTARSICTRRSTTRWPS